MHIRVGGRDIVIAYFFAPLCERQKLVHHGGHGEYEGRQTAESVNP